MHHPHPHQAMTCYFYGYARASLDTDKQKYSVAFQEEKLRHVWKAFAEEDGVQWGGMFSDPATHSHVPLSKREAGQKLIERAKRGDHIGVTNLDRAFRNLREAVNVIDDWVKAGVIVHVIDYNTNTKTEMGIFVLRLMALLAEWERDRIRSRTKSIMNSPKMKAIMAARKGKGKVINHAPMGSKHQGAVGRKVCVPDLVEREAMALIVTLRDTERLSWHEIRIELMVRKMVTRHNRWWATTRIQRAYQCELKLRAETNGKMD